MGQKKQLDADEIAETKKRRRVGFAAVDAGVEASECITIFLVSSREQVGSSDAFVIDPVDLNSFFDDDGKIYGYQGLKISIWVSSVSFVAYADITFKSSTDGGKRTTDLESALQKIFGENIVKNKDDFLQTFETESHYIRSAVSCGEILQHKAYFKSCLNAEASNVEVIRMTMESVHFGHLYSRLVPLVLLLVDGGNPIDINDPKWELYLLVQKTITHQGDIQYLLLGLAAAYRFYHYPDSSRLRLSQILVLPSYQHKGHGRHLLAVLNEVAVAENVYDLTFEEPGEYLQLVRTIIDMIRLLAFLPIRPAVDSVASCLKQKSLSKKIHPPQFGPPLDIVENVRKDLKITKKQFLQCWEVLIYLCLKPVDECLENYMTFITNRVKSDIIGKDSESTGKRVVEVPTQYDKETSFVMFRAQAGEAGRIQMDDENQANREEQLQQLINERLAEIKLIAQKVPTDYA